eukprot:Nitzschia sp. Nitz4//scaffold3_size479765//387451//388551//NITZ4_000165-RA/size479765-processed-gene-1.540-mRNA-1//-1//CDS//3329550953//250//frame0
MKKHQGLAGLFINSNGGVTLASALILIGLPIMFSGQLIPGLAAVVLGLLAALRQVVSDLTSWTRHEIRYESLKPKDIVLELEYISRMSKLTDEAETQFFAALAILAKKWNEATDKSDDTALLCQQAGFLAFRIYPEDDDIVAAAISLVALVAKNNAVRDRNKTDAQDYGVIKPIQILEKSLVRAKKEKNPDKEEALAEVQRKGALYLGALADGDDDKDLPLKIVEAGGMEVILNAANWFRLHEEVVNWSLWAIFTICFNDVRNKVQFVRLGGIKTVSEVLKNNPTSLEVNRHGVAILFDLLREGNEGKQVEWNPWDIRSAALASGLHDIVPNAMKEFSDSMDIIMMGQQILLGTGFTGDIPEFQQM